VHYSLDVCGTKAKAFERIKKWVNSPKK